MSCTPIPFNKPCLSGAELQYIAEAITKGHISGDGVFTKKCQTLLESELQVRKALLTTSCTHALEMAALLLDVAEGDEIIVPSFTFVSTINAFVLHGAKPVFADIRPDTLSINEVELEGLITRRTKAIVPVHYAGVGCEMNVILQLSNRYGVAVIEDNAHGLFGKYRDTYLGTCGAMSTLSFHETKNFTCGEGGALIMNDPRYIERAEIIREKGTDRSRFFRGQVDKYTWTDVGSSYLPSDILSAFLYAQLEARKRIQAERKRVWSYYHTELQAWASEHGVGLPVVPPECEQSYHMYYLLLPSLQVRQELIAHLKGHGILSVFHYLPLHLSAMGRMFGGREGQCPITEDVSDRLLRLPLFIALTEADLARVTSAIKEFRQWGR